MAEVLYWGYGLLFMDRLIRVGRKYSCGGGRSPFPMGLRPFKSLGRRKAMNQVISLLIGAIVIIVLVYVLLGVL